MAVCKFFQQGYCRYGQNCRFEHIYGSKYSYHASAPAQAPPQVAAPAPNGVTDEQLVNQVQTDIQAALRGGQWILSCYSPFKEKPIFPGINDLSTEEARLFIYEAKAKNQVEQAVLYMNNLFKEARQKYEMLLQPNMAIIKVLRSLYKGEIVPSPFDNPPNVFGTSASSVFRSAVQSAPSQNVTPSVFQQNSIFNSQDTAKSIFSTAVSNIQPTQNQNVFNQNQPTAQSIFSAAVNNFSTANQTNPAGIFANANQTIFAKEPSNTSPFNQNNSPFNQNTSPFTQTNAFTQNTSHGVYSKMEELTQDDLEAFKSHSFILGAVPEIAPPYELCTYQ